MRARPPSTGPAIQAWLLGEEGEEVGVVVDDEDVDDGIEGEELGVVAVDEAMHTY